jgi:hypothetical protein
MVSSAFNLLRHARNSSGVIYSKMKGVKKLGTLHDIFQPLLLNKFTIIISVKYPISAVTIILII